MLGKVELECRMAHSLVAAGPGAVMFDEVPHTSLPEENARRSRGEANRGEASRSEAVEANGERRRDHSIKPACTDAYL